PRPEIVLGAIGAEPFRQPGHRVLKRVGVRVRKTGNGYSLDDLIRFSALFGRNTDEISRGVDLDEGGRDPRSVPPRRSTAQPHAGLPTAAAASPLACRNVSRSRSAATGS